MDKRQIKNLIQELEQERDTLDKMINFLQSRFKSGENGELSVISKTNLVGRKRPGRPPKAAPVVKAKTKRSRREVSPEARRKMSEAAKKRHAQRRREQAQSGD